MQLQQWKSQSADHRILFYLLPNHLAKVQPNSTVVATNINGIHHGDKQL